MRGLYSGNHITIREEEYKHFRNLGGYDYLGKTEDVLRSPQEQEQTAATCEKLGLTGLVMIGATHTLTDAAMLSEYFLKNNVQTRVIAIPASIDGNIHH